MQQEPERVSELSKIDPKCWCCGTFVKPLVLRYQPLLCLECDGGMDEKRKEGIERRAFADGIQRQALEAIKRSVAEEVERKTGGKG